MQFNSYPQKKRLSWAWYRSRQGHFFFARPRAAMVDFPGIIWQFETVENTISRLFVERLPMNVPSVPNVLAFTRHAETGFHLLKPN